MEVVSKLTRALILIDPSPSPSRFARSTQTTQLVRLARSTLHGSQIVASKASVGRRRTSLFVFHPRDRSRNW